MGIILSTERFKSMASGIANQLFSFSLPGIAILTPKLREQGKDISSVNGVWFFFPFFPPLVLADRLPHLL